MIDAESIITAADSLFPGNDVFTIDQVLELFKSVSESNIKDLPSMRIYKRLVRFLFSKNMSNLDTMMLITAMKGGGKSSTAIQLCRVWCSILGIRFDVKKHIAYTNADLSRKIDTLPPFSPLIADESVRFITSEDWNKKDNKELKKKLAQIREKHLFFCLCFPLKIKKVDKTYLESFVNYWIEVYSRGSAAIFVRDSNPVFDSWRLDAFKDIGSYNEFSNEELIKQKLKEHPNFWKFMKIPRVPKDIYAKYKAIRDENVYRDDSGIADSVTKEDIYRSALLLALNDIMTNDQNLSMMRILMLIKNNYDISIPKSDMANIITDANRMVVAMRENAMLGE